MKITYKQAARDDLVRQFRYYLITVDRPDVAVRFRNAVRKSVNTLRDRPAVGARYHGEDPSIINLRSWPVEGFEAIRLYYTVDSDSIHIIRILHGSRDVRRLLSDQEFM